MKKQIVLMFISLFTAFILNACSNTTTESSVSGGDSTKVEQTAEVYACPMHPEEKSDKPGECPQCHMPLEK